MGVHQRSRLQLDERRAQLVELGLELFCDCTYDELSIEGIARAAGISKGLLYHYFPSKRDYYLAVLREAGRQLVEQTDIQPDAGSQPDAASRPGVVPGVAPGVADLRRGMDAYLAFVEQRARAYAFLLRGSLGSDPQVAAIVEGVRRHYLHGLLAALGADEGNAPLRTALRGWLGFVEAASLDWTQRRDQPREALRDLLVDLCVASVTRALRQAPRR